MQLLKTKSLVTTTSSWSILMAMAYRSIPATQESYQSRVRGLSNSGRESRVWPLGVGEMAETMCLPTGTAKASKPHSQPAQKYAENSGFALVVKSAPARQAGSVSSLLGVLHVASWHFPDMADRTGDFRFLG